MRNFGTLVTFGLLFLCSPSAWPQDRMQSELKLESYQQLSGRSAGQFLFTVKNCKRAADQSESVFDAIIGDIPDAETYSLHFLGTDISLSINQYCRWLPGPQRAILNVSRADNKAKMVRYLGYCELMPGASPTCVNVVAKATKDLLTPKPIDRWNDVLFDDVNSTFLLAALTRIPLEKVMEVTDDKYGRFSDAFAKRAYFESKRSEVQQKIDAYRNRLPVHAIAGDYDISLASYDFATKSFRVDCIGGGFAPCVPMGRKLPGQTVSEPLRLLRQTPRLVDYSSFGLQINDQDAARFSRFVPVDEDSARIVEAQRNKGMKARIYFTTPSTNIDPASFSDGIKGKVMPVTVDMIQLRDSRGNVIGVMTK